MSNDNYEEIFAAARQLPQAERERYVTETCADQEEQEHVLALLQKSAKADGYFGELGAPPHVHEASIVEATGDSIGPYKLLQKLGEGGFGVVFMAEQCQAITRRVALKIIKQGMDTRQVIARFEAERQALAMMDHANIARVFDAGATESGRPYFAMELVEGEPITEFCDAKAYDTQQRLDLFLDVCAAVNHAHQKGIIHRDLKPSNILVGLDGDTPVVKVIDFGIAKAIQQNLAEQTLLTRHEQFLGTPAYVSPEQASLSPIDVDTRSDIYSLGVILYELLAGRPPIDTRELQSAGFDEMRRLICEKQTPKPSTRLNSCGEKERQSIAGKRHTEAHKLGLLLKGDLDWIVLKCLEKDRHRRYETANALASDIRNFQRDEPVSAVAPSPGYRLRKLVRRNRAAFGAAAAVMLALVAALGISIAALLSEKEARREQEAERSRAEASERSARQISSILQNTLGSIDPAIAQGRDTSILRDLFDQMAVQIENEIPTDSPEGIDLRLTIGKVYTALGEREKSKQILEKAHTGAVALGDQQRIVDILLEQAWAEHADYEGNEQKRLALLEEAVALADPDSPQSMVAKSRLGADLKGARGRQLAQEAKDLSEQLLDDADPVRSIVFGNYFVTFRERLSGEERLAMLIEMTDGARKRFGETHPRYAYALGILANWYYRMGVRGKDADRLELAVKHGEQACDLNRELFLKGHDRRLEGLWRLAQIYLAAGDIESSQKTWEEALEEQEAQHLSARRELLYCYRLRQELARMLADRGLGEEALELAMFLAKPGEIPTNARRVQASIAVADGKFKEAAQIMEPLAGTERWSNDRKNYAILLLYCGEREEYQKSCTEMFDLLDDSRSVESREHLVKLCSAAPWPADSGVPEKMLTIARQLASEDPDQAWSCLAVGMAEYRSGHFEKALPFLEFAAKEPARQSCRALASAYGAMANSKVGRQGEAEKYLRTAKELHVPLDEGAATDWPERMLAELALREAREMLDAAP